MLVSELDRGLGQDRPRVELRIHAVEGEADLGLTVPDRPCHRIRPPVVRKQGRVAVDRAQPRHRESVRWNLPRKRGTEEQVRLVASQERRDPCACGRDDDVQALRRVADELVECIASVTAGVFPGAQQRDGLVPEGTQETGQAV
jgi:hypothetical protein